jgi:hypothetical protein
MVVYLKEKKIPFATCVIHSDDDFFGNTGV